MFWFFSGLWIFFVFVLKVGYYLSMFTFISFSVTSFFPLTNPDTEVGWTHPHDPPSPAPAFSCIVEPGSGIHIFTFDNLQMMVCSRHHIRWVWYSQWIFKVCGKIWHWNKRSCAQRFDGQGADSRADTWWWSRCSQLGKQPHLGVTTPLLSRNIMTKSNSKKERFIYGYREGEKEFTQRGEQSSKCPEWKAGGTISTIYRMQRRQAGSGAMLYLNLQGWPQWGATFSKDLLKVS